MSGEPIVEIADLSKTFPGTVALRDVSLTFHGGEIHALLGMNGSGKSTLVKVLAGFHEPDPGARVTVGGEPLPFGNPDAPSELGMHFVHQDLALCPTLDTVENLALGGGYATGAWGPISWRAETRRAREIMSSFGYEELDVRRPVETLTAAEKAGVAIARAFSRDVENARAVILDEPTASMPAAEFEAFVKLLERVKARGVAVVFITHHLHEIFRLADKVSVLRDGRLVGTRQVAELTHDELVEAIVGSRVNSELERLRPPAKGAARAMLEARDVGGGSLASLDLAVHEGEVLGVAGLAGSGRESVCGVLFGAIPRTGDVTVGGTPLPAQRPDLALRRGIALVPAERRADALFPEMSVRENLLVSSLRRFVKRGFLRGSLERAEAASWIDRLQVKTSSAEASISVLSGGNQQKVVFARALRRTHGLLLLDEPTQGVDVSASADIYRVIVDTAAGGGAVIVASSDGEELARVSSRVVVLSAGTVAGELSGDDVTVENIERLTLADEHTLERSEV